MNRFVLTPRAGRDLDDIWSYSAYDNVQAPDAVIDAPEEAMMKLLKNPGIGHRRGELADKRNRFIPVPAYRIVYRPETKPLQIIRVLHGVRGVQSLLGLAPDRTRPARPRRRQCEPRSREYSS